jgi:secretion/DNA translocation related TadE-like protein
MTACSVPRRPDAGAGSVLVLAVVAVLVLVCALVVPLYMAIAAKRAAAAAADAAALAAADALAGTLPGFPCEVAEQVARSAGTVLERCGTEADTALVTVSLPILGMPVEASARAGPPPGPGRHAAQSPGSD